LIGYVDLPSRLAPTASQLYGTNLAHLLADMGGGKSFHIDLDDPVVRGALVLHAGELTWPPPRVEPAPQPQPKPTPLKSVPPPVPSLRAPKPASPFLRFAQTWGAALFTLAALAFAGAFAPPAFLAHLTVFVLA